MNNEVWSKVAEFLKELRCEDIGRKSYLQLAECKNAMNDKVQKYNTLECALEEIEPGLKEKVMDYLSSVEICSEEECQQAYLQGIIDGILIVAGIGKIPSVEIIEQIKSYLK